MVTRKINWVSAISPSSEKEISILEDKLASFYSGNPDYYGDIDFTASNWSNKAETGYQEIISVALQSEQVCEFGCGSANILGNVPEIAMKYSGCDFSEALINNNRKKYPAARFECIKTANSLPFESGCFDFVFSVFVLEHCTRPHRVLDECARLLKPGGRLIILCPDFMGTGRMTSQRAGYSEGNTRQKISRKKYLDALVTFFDNRVRIPFRCMSLRRQVKKDPAFMINTSPVVFEDKFIPDVDAVYVTNKEELIRYLGKNFSVMQSTAAMADYTRKKKLIFLSLVKK